MGGFIGQAGLADWWLGEFDDAERAHILATFQPMGASDGAAILVKGESGGADNDPSNLLSSLAGWFKRESDRSIGYRIIDKAEELLATSPSILTKHFTYQAKAQVYYRWRDVDSFALDRAEKACRDQIALAPMAAKEFLGEGPRPIIEIDWLNDGEDEIERKVELIKKDEATASGDVLGFLPSHHGYRQLAIILEKRGDYRDALALSEQAKGQGWKGDWDSRITRLTKKLAKGSP
ncbi:hypothetical protein Ga0102493_112978 [Erythrobacter litoralis]|uniref:Uncharacterized protein n=1 Tax=Erythrobacter litoralis TaxID=39960 RepID=A0A074N0R6_9SPHN|nr:hypothetical protein [Erythrobacter litoralis]AOL23976.1 hypothetical protein Ga0102493_112978 [Erythrobacter litoralis]KEO98545.1 hypothetical protein EH32_05400 [Erythrobacter litoralis]